MVYTQASVKDAQNICVRLKVENDEPKRWIEVLRRGLHRNPMASKSDIARAIFKFQPYEEGLVTEEDRRYFLHGPEERTRTKVVGRAIESPPDLTVAKPRKRNTG